MTYYEAQWDTSGGRTSLLINTSSTQSFHNLQTLSDSRPLKCSACLSNAYATVSKSDFSDKPNHSGAHFLLDQNVVFVLSNFASAKKENFSLK